MRGGVNDEGSAGGSGSSALADWPQVDLAAILPARLLALISAHDPATASARESLGATAACEQVLRNVSALQLRFMARARAAFDEPDGSGVAVFSGLEHVSAELGPYFGLSRQSAQNKVIGACELVNDLPKLVDLMETGALDLQRARAVDEVMREVLDPSDPAWDTVHDKIAARAPHVSNRWLRELTRRAIQNADPEAAARRHQEKVKDRRVALDPLPDAMASITAILPADHAQLVNTVLDALSDGCRDHTRAAGAPDERTHAQRRADAFVALFRSVAAGAPIPVLTSHRDDSADDQLHFGGRYEPVAPQQGGLLGWWIPPDLPGQQGRRPHITVTMPLSTLTGLDNQAADLAGYGPIPAELARAIAAEARRYQVVPLPDPLAGDPLRNDPLRDDQRRDGAPSAPRHQGASSFHGPGDQERCTAKDRAYRPAQSVVDQVVAFHQECRHPGCSRRAQTCDLDHVTPYPDGPTCACNLMPLCRFHHRLKTHGGWGARFTTPDEPHPAGTVEWTSPLGLRYYDVPRIHDLGFGTP